MLLAQNNACGQIVTPCSSMLHIRTLSPAWEELRLQNTFQHHEEDYVCRVRYAKRLSSARNSILSAIKHLVTIFHVWPNNWLSPSVTETRPCYLKLSSSYFLTGVSLSHRFVTASTIAQSFLKYCVVFVLVFTCAMEASVRFWIEAASTKLASIISFTKGFLYWFHISISSRRVRKLNKGFGNEIRGSFSCP